MNWSFGFGASDIDYKMRFKGNTQDEERLTYIYFPHTCMRNGQLCWSYFDAGEKLYTKRIGWNGKTGTKKRRDTRAVNTRASTKKLFNKSKQKAILTLECTERL